LHRGRSKKGRQKHASGYYFREGLGGVDHGLFVPAEAVGKVLILMQRSSNSGSVAVAKNPETVGEK